MRITVEIDADTLQKVKEATGEKKKAPALQKAIEAYLREEHKRTVLEKIMASGIGFRYTNDEIEAFGEYDTD